MKTQIAWMFASAALLVGCTTAEEKYAGSNTAPNIGTKFSELPMAVQRTINERAPGGQIDDIDREERDGTTVYEVTFAEPGLNPKMHITEDGRVVRDGDMIVEIGTSAPIVEAAGAAPGRTDLWWNDLPAPVQQTILDNAPGSLVGDIYEKSWRGQKVYEVNFDSIFDDNRQLNITQSGGLLERVR
jgi:hypothetical protein